MDVVDTIVAVAGTAGCVVAARRSENCDGMVLLPEASPDFADLDELPTSLASGDGEGDDWGFEATVCDGRTAGLAQGKVLGG